MPGVRIIAGKFRHRILEAPPSKTTRPITDRVKQSLFDALAIVIGFQGVRVLDIFAGTGGLGLECISRGAASAVFVEKDRHALTALRNNINALGVKAISQVVAADAFARRDLWRGGMGTFDLIFVDPPYPMLDSSLRMDFETLISQAAEESLNPDGIVLFRHPANFSPASLQLAERIKRRQAYGSMAVTWLQRWSAPDDGDDDW